MATSWREVGRTLGMSGRACIGDVRRLKRCRSLIGFNAARFSLSSVGGGGSPASRGRTRAMGEMPFSTRIA